MAKWQGPNRDPDPEKKPSIRKAVATATAVALGVAGVALSSGNKPDNAPSSRRYHPPVTAPSQSVPDLTPESTTMTTPIPEGPLDTNVLDNDANNLGHLVPNTTPTTEEPDNDSVAH